MGFRVTRSAKASWQGTVTGGDGRLALDSGAFEGPYSLRARVEGIERHTNPEEMIAAAEAGCFTMSLANLLEEAGHPARDLQTTARATLEQVRSGFDITRIELSTVADVPGLDAERFERIAREAKNCTVSRALRGVEITLDATLQSRESVAGA
ncbi:MAG TPA: OsmC family peroxiredoxin [Solirubrobacteraceae bacterium]|nr:OsmC family peroxiredoxin [Solirubrobacteraceae bacterium]